jgi:hypothetical protein
MCVLYIYTLYFFVVGKFNILNNSKENTTDFVINNIHSFIHSLSSLSYDRSKASSKASSLHSAIQSFLFQMRVSSPFLKVIQ